MSAIDPFAGFDLERAIRERAGRAGFVLEAAAVTILAEHARRVLRANERLHLTTITEPSEFVERHLGESFEGAALLPEDARGLVLDLGSGNGYPGIPLAVARPRLRVVLAEASRKKAAFLEATIATLGLASVEVFAHQVQRPSDLGGLGPFRAIISRAMGHWEKILPRFASALEPDGRVLLWAGAEVETIAKREVWKRYALVGRRELPGLERGWVWEFR